MKKILVFGMSANYGGVEAFLMNYYRRLDRSELQLDFLCNSLEPIAFEEELRASGAQIFKVPARSQNPVAYRRALREFFETHASKYHAIWVNLNSLANIDYLKMAKRYGISKRIIHSHNSRNMDGFLRGQLHQLNRQLIARYATDFWACSPNAGKWFYPERLVNQVLIVPNAIETRTFSFDDNERQRLRASLGLTDQVVVGNIGRLHFQKNQEFILKIFARAQKARPNLQLVLVGSGDDEQKLKEQAIQLGLQQYVHFTGMQKNAPKWYSVFDVFLFPSLFEGLSVAAIEAQANGLPILAAEHILPKEIQILSTNRTLSLDDSIDSWARELLAMIDSVHRLSQSAVSQAFETSPYEVAHSAKWLKDKLEK